MEECIKCPNCKSESVISSTRGFSLAKAATGGILLGPLGLLAGTHKMNKVSFTCLHCGHKFGVNEAIRAAQIANAVRMSGKSMEPLSPEERERIKSARIARQRSERNIHIISSILAVILFLSIIILLESC